MNFTSVTIKDLTIDANPEYGDHVWVTINGHDATESESIDKDAAKEIVELLTERFGLWNYSMRVLP